jgi:lysophospholipase L1-like esterase
MNKTFDKEARVLFVGDSITASGRFVSKIYDYYHKNFPSMNVRIYNKGIPGDSARGMLRRFVDDIMDTHATEVVLMAGMNDVVRELYGMEEPDEETLAKREQAKVTHCESMVKLAELFTENGLPITLCSSTPYDEISDVASKNYFGCHGALCDIFRRDCENLAKFNLKNVVDFLTPMTKLLSDLKAKGAPSIVGGDRVHPTAIGHEVMARLFLISQGINVEHPTADSIISGKVSLPELGELNAERYDYELRCRSIAFVDYHCAWDRKAYPTIEEKVAYWEENKSKYKEGQYTYIMVERYIKEKPNEELYRKKLYELTDKMANKS